MIKTLKLLALPVLLTAVFGTSAAIAQGGGQPPAAPQQQAAPAPANFDDETKENFVNAYVEVINIQVKLEEDLRAATEEAAAIALQQEAQTQMVAAVTGNDLTVETYNQIIQVSASNEELMNELEAAIAEAMES